MPNQDDVYFAASKKEDIGQALQAKIEDELHTNVRGAQYSRAMAHYYSDEGGPTGITRGGEQGELAEMVIPKAKSLAKAVCGIVTGPKMTWKPMAANGSVGARKATTVASNLLEFYWKRRHLNRKVYQQVETAFAFSEGQEFLEFDETIGPPLGIDNGRLIHEGDIVIHNVLPWDVVRDASYSSWDDCEWTITTLYKNRWNLVGIHEADILGEPAREKILAASKKSRWLDVRRDSTHNTDIIPVHYFHHRPSPALPAGRETVFLNADCVLVDRPLPYDEVPIYRLAPDEKLGTPYGYTPWWDTFSIQELMDGLETSVATNQLTLGTQSIAMEIGTQTPADHAHGMKVFYYKPGGRPPEAIQLTRSPPEVFAHIKQKSQDQMQLVGLNDVYRGQAPGSDMNAQAFALLASMAIQANSPFQSATVDAVARLGYGLLKILEKRVSQERKIAITGKHSKHLYSTLRYTGQDLKPIDEVQVDIGNPMEQTAAGRMQMMDLYGQRGMLKTPDDIQQVADTGRLESATDDIRDELLLIAQENEALANGDNPPVHVYDDHIKHCAKNVSPIRNPDGRNDPKVVAAVQAHWDEHYRLYWGLPADPMTGMPADPRLDPQYPVRSRILLGQQPPPMEAMPPPTEGGPPPGDAGPPPPGGPLPPPGQDPMAALEMPTNPMNGQPFSPTAGPLGPTS